MGHGFGRGDDGMTDWRGGRVPKSSGEIRCLSYLDRAMAEMTWSRVMARDLGVVPCAACLTGMEEIVSGICAWLAAGVSRDWASDLAWCEASMEREGEGGETGSSEKRGFVDFGALGALGAALNLVRTSLRL
ncbi:MAG: hypothetical protein FWC40_07860, partial [Proteobacteria bacterium]|nr:hypothetical protein [Pseudomonadota bacterium]